MEDLITAAELLVAYLKKVWGPMEHWDDSRRFVVNQMVLEINEARAAKNAEPPAIPQQPQNEICSNATCDYCVHHGEPLHKTRCDGCDGHILFEGRKLSPVR